MKNNIIFICTSNTSRSITARVYFQNKYPELRFRSAGVNKFFSHRYGGVYLERYMMDTANRVVCMENVHHEIIKQRFGNDYDYKIEILDLGDTEGFMSDSLIKMLEQKFKI
jgi:predicted protein tyrosine phosphatase